MNHSFKLKASVVAMCLLGGRLAASSPNTVEFAFTGTVMFTNVPGMSDLPPSRLTISRSGNLLEVRWSTNLTSYQLESTTNMVGGLAHAGWNSYPQPPVSVGSEFKVNVIATNSMQFFRLRKVQPEGDNSEPDRKVISNPRLVLRNVHDMLLRR